MLGVAGEFRGRVAANTLWPRTAIDTAAMAEFKSHLDSLRSPEIMADAAYLILTSDARTVTGNFFVVRPGDVILTGTPDGVGIGRNPRVYMKPGASLTTRIEGLGSITNKIVDSTHRK